MPWVDSAEIDGFLMWWEGKREGREKVWSWVPWGLGGVWRVGKGLVLLVIGIPIGVFFYGVRWWKGEARLLEQLPRAKRIDLWVRGLFGGGEEGDDVPATDSSSPPEEVLPRQTETGTTPPPPREGESTAPPYFSWISRNVAGPKALRVHKIPFAQDPDSQFRFLTLRKLTQREQRKVFDRTQYFRRRRKGLVGREEMETFDEEGDEEAEWDGDVLDRLFTSPMLPRYFPPQGTLRTRLSRRWVSLGALREMGVEFEVDDDREFVVVQQALNSKGVKAVYRISQFVRRRRWGMQPDPDAEDDGYDLGQTSGGEDEDDSSTDDGDDDEGGSEESEIPETPRAPRKYAVGPEHFRGNRGSRSTGASGQLSEDDMDESPLAPRGSRTYSRRFDGTKENVGATTEEEDESIPRADRQPNPYSSTSRRSGGGYSQTFNGFKEDLGGGARRKWAAEDRARRPYAETHRRPRTYASTSRGRKEDLGHTDDVETNPVRERRSRPYPKPHPGQKEDFRSNTAARRFSAPSEYIELSLRQLGEQSAYERATGDRNRGNSSGSKRRRRGYSTKRNWFIPKQGGEAARPVYLSGAGDSTQTTRETPVPRTNTGITSVRDDQPGPGDFRRDSHSAGERTSTTPQSYQPDEPAHNGSTIPEPATNKEPTTKPETTPPRTGETATEAEPAPTEATSTVPPSETTAPAPRRPRAIPKPVHTNLPDSPPTLPTVPMPKSQGKKAYQHASQPLLRSLAWHISGILVDCIDLWTTCDELGSAKKPIDIQLFLQKLSQKIVALRNLFQETFDVDPELLLSSYQYRLEAMEPELDNILGLLQLLRQALDAENPAVPDLGTICKMVSGIIKGVTERLGRKWRGSDSIVSEERRIRLRKLISAFIIEDEETARVAAEQRVKEKETREKAAKEEAEKDAAATPMEVCTPVEDAATKKPGPAKPKRARYDGPHLPLKGPTEFKDALRVRLSQGFLPTETSAEDFLCGLRALIISLVSMKKLQPHSVTPEAILAKLFENPEVIPKYDLIANPEGQRGHPTEEYHDFLRETLEQWQNADAATANEAYNAALCKQNFDSTQLWYMLQLLPQFGFILGDEELSLGIVTAGNPDVEPPEPPTIQIHCKTKIDPEKVVWIYNDNITVITNGKGLGHWSGFAHNIEDCRHWAPIVETWGVDTMEEGKANKDNPADDDKHGDKQDKTRQQGLSDYEYLRNLTVLFNHYLKGFKQNRKRYDIMEEEVKRWVDAVEDDILLCVRATGCVGTRDEREFIQQRKIDLEYECEKLLADIERLWRKRSGPGGGYRGGIGSESDGMDTDEPPQRHHNPGKRPIRGNDRGRGPRGRGDRGGPGGGGGGRDDDGGERRPRPDQSPNNNNGDGQHEYFQGGYDGGQDGGDNGGGTGQGERPPNPNYKGKNPRGRNPGQGGYQGSNNDGRHNQQGGQSPGQGGFQGGYDGGQNGGDNGGGTGSDERPPNPNYKGKKPRGGYQSGNDGRDNQQGHNPQRGNYQGDHNQRGEKGNRERNPSPGPNAGGGNRSEPDARNERHPNNGQEGQGGNTQPGVEGGKRNGGYRSEPDGRNEKRQKGEGGGGGKNNRRDQQDENPGGGFEGGGGGGAQGGGGGGRHHEDEDL